MADLNDYIMKREYTFKSRKRVNKRLCDVDGFIVKVSKCYHLLQKDTGKTEIIQGQDKNGNVAVPLGD